MDVTMGAYDTGMIRQQKFSIRFLFRGFSRHVSGRLGTILYMFVARCVIELELYGIGSLKDKRSVLKPIMARLPKQFNVAIAEVDHHDSWNSAVIGLAGVGNDSRYLQGLMEKAVGWLEQNYPDVPIGVYSIEID